mgnify:CR=1 FL=1
MDGKQAIICKILDDANEKAQSIISNAKSIVDDKITDAEDFAKEYEAVSAAYEAKKEVKKENKPKNENLIQNSRGENQEGRRAKR